MNVNKLKAKIVENGMNVEELADIIGTNRATLYRKLNKTGRITIKEAARMKEALGMTAEEAQSIFFAE